MKSTNSSIDLNAWKFPLNADKILARIEKDVAKVVTNVLRQQIKEDGLILNFVDCKKADVVVTAYLPFLAKGLDLGPLRKISLFGEIKEDIEESPEKIGAWISALRAMADKLAKQERLKPS